MNYLDTFIAVAPDCPVMKAVPPPSRWSRASIAEIQFGLLSRNPYHYTQEDVLWHTHVRHKVLTGAQTTRTARSAFLARPQPCLRASPLPRRYGWGLHFDSQGRAALVARESKTYASLEQRTAPRLQVLSAFRARRPRTNPRA